MKTKNIILSLLGILIFSLVFSYTLVFAGNIGKISFKLSDNIFLDSLELNANRVVLYTRENPSKFIISGDCNIYSKLVKSQGNNHIFDIKLLDNDCDKENINVYFSYDGKSLLTSFRISSAYNLYSQLLNKSDFHLDKALKTIDKSIAKLGKYEIYDNKTKYLDFIKENRKLQELKYMKKFVSNILEKRKDKYRVPVAGKVISTKKNKLPNAGRPYRSSYTDGIHHGWDVDANIGDTVVSLDDGIVIRVVNNFTFSDLGGIKYGNSLSYDEKLINLDILRGNQIWVKTMKGDVAFYSHLNQVFPSIKEGVIVTKGEPLGTVGITGVPDKNYTDYHLHIPVHKNPYSNKKDTFLDIMKWDWYFKGESSNHIIENQTKVFE